MNISISSWSYRHYFRNEGMDFLEFIEEVSKVGSDAFEIHPSFIDLNNMKQDLKDIVNKAKELDLSISSLIAANDFALPSITERAEQVENMKEKIEVAADVGIKKMNVFTGYHIDGQDPTMETMRVIDCYREVIPVAEANDIILCMENHSSVHPDADGILAIIEAVGSENFKTNPDPTNFCKNHTEVSKENREIIYKETAKVAPLTANSHLKINTFDESGKPEYVDVPRILDIYKEVGYDGDIVLEYFGEGKPDESITNGIKYLKEIL